MLPKVEQLVHQHLIEVNVEKEHRKPEGLRARVSSAGKCARAIGLGISGLDATNPPGPDSLVNFYVGDKVHDLVQAAILRKWPDAETEKRGQIEDWLVGHSDVLYRAEDGELVVLEIKSMADFGFEKATGAQLKSNGRWRKKEPDPPEGPSRSHLLQAGIYATMHGAKYVAIVYVRKTATLGEPVTWEWRYTLDQLSEAVEGEIERLRGILESVQNNTIPARLYEGQEITDPAKTKWPCGYCDYLNACLELGPGEVEIV